VSGGTPPVLRGKGVRIAGGTTAAGAPVPTPSAPSAPAPRPPASPHPTTPDHASERPERRGRALLGKLLGKLDERRAR
jgi:hypothetical protein